MPKGKIHNPLTIIAIFAGIAEVAGTTVLLGLPLDIQRYFVWFVMAFPIVLVAAFFLILIFKHEVLYAPSDFNNEQLFIDLLNRRLRKDLSEFSEIVSEAQEAINKPDSSELQEKQKVAVVEVKLEELKNKLESVKYHTSIEYFPHMTSTETMSALQRDVMAALHRYPEGLDISEISKELGTGMATTSRLIKRMIDKEIIYKKTNGRYFIKE